MPVYEIKSSFKNRSYETIVIAESGTSPHDIFNKDYSFHKIEEIKECKGNRFVSQKRLPTEEEIDKLESLLKKSGF